MSRSSIDWARRLAEAVTITLSILAAFGIDAWWDGVQEARTDRSHLENVLRELQTTAGLLDRAIELHALTETQAITMLGMTSGQSPVASADSLAELSAALEYSYVINAPTGALAAATLSGAVARLESEELKTRLLSWESYLEDLLEEEFAGNENAYRFQRFLAARISLHPTVRAAGRGVSGEQIGEREGTLPPTIHREGVVTLLGDREFENEVLILLRRAESSREEAQAFRGLLAEVVERLEAALAGSR